jgi:phospholipid N-methyltransferase
MEWLLFWQQFIKHPGCVGSILPSSRYLARKLVSNIEWDRCKTVVELGAGTGTFTKYLVDAKPARTKLLIFENNSVFRVLLTKRFREITLFDDATNLEEVLFAEGIKGVDCVVSGLPFAVFPDEKRQDILRQVQRVLGLDAQFITFQYSPQIYRELCSIFSDVQIRFTLLNVPPAIIYICRR